MPSLANVQRYISAGFQRLDFHQLDSSGLPAGVTGQVTAGATGVPAGRITAVRTMNINIPAATAVPIVGDNIPQGTFVFQNASPRSFDVAFSEDDFADRQAFQGIIPRNFGNHTFSGRDASPFSLNNLMIIGVSNASAQAPGIKGLGMYAGVVCTRAQMTVRGRGPFDFQAAAEYFGTVNLNAGDGYPWGTTYQVANEGFSSAFVLDWTEQYPVTCHRWTQTGSGTVFNLGETPASSSLSDVLVFTVDTNGIPTGPYTSGVTVSTTGKTLTFSLAPTNGYAIIAYYGYVPS